MNQFLFLRKNNLSRTQLTIQTPQINTNTTTITTNYDYNCKYTTPLKMYLRQQYGYKWDPVKRERVFCWPDPGHPTWTIITDLETGKRIELLKEECLDTDGNDSTLR